MMDIQNLERWVDLANTGVVLALALSFIFGGASIYLSRKLNKAKDAQSAREKQIADVKIEEARASAAKANEETATLSQKNIKLRTDLESATAESRSRQSELTVEQQKLTKAQKELAEAEQKRAEAQLALEKILEEVRRRQMPRTLSPGQRTRLIELLRASPKGEIEITCVMGDGEGYAFATELDGLLKAAGWNISGGGVTQAVYSGGNPKGAGIIVRNPQTAPHYAASLQKAFSDAGYPIAGAENPQLPEGKVVLLVGNKP